MTIFRISRHPNRTEERWSGEISWTGTTPAIILLGVWQQHQDQTEICPQENILNWKWPS